MTQVAVPQSVREYMHRRSVRTAIDHLLDAGSAALPEGLEDWSEVRAYHRAYLSACQLRGEHALLLMDLWEAVWRPCIEASSKFWKALSPDEQAEDGGVLVPSPDDLWAGAHPFNRVFVTKDGKTFLDVGIDYWHDVGVRLYLSVYDDERDIASSDHIPLPKPWLPDTDEEGYRHTDDGAYLPTDGEAIDVSDLRAAGAAALQAI